MLSEAPEPQSVKEFVAQPLPPNAEVALVNLQPPTLWQSATGWFTALKPKQQIALGGSALFAMVIGGLTMPQLLGNKQATVDPPPIQKPDETAVLQAGNQTYEQTAHNTALVVGDTRTAIQAQEGKRLLQIAEGLVVQKKDSCYQQSPGCVLDRLETEAISRFEQATKERNWQDAQSALSRLDALEFARADKQLPEPKANLTALALRNRLQARQTVEAASAESLAKDTLKGNSQ